MMHEHAFALACWFLYDDCDYDIDHAVKIYLSVKNDEHRGDCTKEPFTCLRCQYEDAMILAKKIEPYLDEHMLLRAD